MIQSNVILFGWNRPIVGREGMAAELFAHTVNFYEKLKSSNNIENYQPVFLASHGGDLNGFFLVTGTHAQLDTLQSSDEFVDIVTRAGLYLEGVGVIEGYVGNTVQDLMTRWTKAIPPR
jgi:hypothetical protein